MLDYRTVSTQHATVTFRKGQFLFRDLSSSNGSMLNLRQPLRLPYNQWVRLRCGRSIVALKAKRSWVRRKLSSMSSTLAGAAAAATGGAFASSAASSQQPGQHHGSRESLGAGMGAGPRMSVSQHLNLELLLQQQQQQQQQQAATQRGRPPHPQQAGGGGGVVDSSSSVNSAASAGSDASGGGAIGTASTASPAVGPTAKGAGGGDEQQVELLESLCRIEATPRPHSGLGASGLLTPGGGRFYQSIAGESMSPSAVSAALFELHLQVGASSRRVFEGIDADGAAADAAGAADESAYADAEEGERSQNHHHQQQHKSRPASLVGVQAMKLDGLVGEGTEGQQQQQPPPVTAAAPPPARQIFHGVHFIPQDSPENSPLSEVGR